MTEVVREPAAPSRARLDSLTGLRFYAAFAVLLSHTIPYFFPLAGLTQLAIVGPVGVGFFFVLSGFILTWTWSPTTPRGVFYGRRFARIYPMTLLTTLIAIALGLGDGRWYNHVSSILLLQAWGPDSPRLGANGPSWSLSCELLFYATFPFLVPRISRLTRARCLRLGLMVVAAMIVWTGVYGVLAKAHAPLVSIISTYTFPPYRLGEFVIGICLATAVKDGWRPAYATLRIALSTALAAALALAGINWVIARTGLHLGDGVGLPYGLLDLMFLPFTILLVLTGALVDLRGDRSFLAGPWHVRLGLWSFALYLIQELVITPVREQVDYDDVRLSGLLLTAGLLGLCVAISAAAYTFVERPAESWLRARLGTPRASLTHPGATSEPLREQGQ